MLEILQYYTSGFWVWTGITFGLAIVATVIGETLIGIFKRRVK